MKKLDILKQIGKAGLNLAGLQAGAGKDKVRALEAERKLLELKLALTRQALSDVHALATEAIGRDDNDRAPERMLSRLNDIVREANEALEVIGRVE